MSLQDDSSALRKDLEAKIGDKIKFIDCETEALLQSGIINNSLQVGQKAPDFTLPNATGGEVSLSSLLKKGPVVLSFYRGEWCPFCNLELRAYQQALPKMEALGAVFVAVSPEKPEFAQLLGVWAVGLHSGRIRHAYQLPPVFSGPRVAAAEFALGVVA
jgi:thiol-disulfide isomerase/thioredoxin